MNKTLEFINKSGTCCGCGSCVENCPQQCITMGEDPEGFPTPEIDFSNCIDCGYCTKSCPYSKESYHIGHREAPQFFAARLKQASLRAKSSSGGAFRALSDAVLAKGGIVAGVQFDGNLTAEFALAQTPAERDRFCSSKYVQAWNPGIFQRIAEHLEKGQTVFFTGNPCIVAGLYAFLGKDDPNLITADFICHGVPSPAVFREYKKHLEKQYGAKMISLVFRDKSTGWDPMRLTAKFENGAVYSKIHIEDPYFLFFLAAGMSRPCCAKCPYTRVAGREADLTLGDAWKAVTLQQDWNDNSGISNMIVYSEKGKKLLDAAAKDLELHACELANVDQGYLHRPGHVHPDRAEFFEAFRKHGIEYALQNYSGPRPLLRRLKTRSKKILNAVLPEAEKKSEQGGAQ